MSFSRVNPGGWAVNAVLTAAQQNQLDIDHANAIDGVNGGTLTLAALLNFGGTGGVQLNKTFLNPRTITSAYTLDASGFDFALICSPFPAGLVLSLTAAVVGRVVIVNYAAGAGIGVSIVPSGANTIGGINAPYALTQIGSGVVLVGISSGWNIVAKV